MRWLLAATLLVACSNGSPRAVPTTAPPASAPEPTATPEPTPTPEPIQYVFPVAGCAVTYARTHHDYPATDIHAKPGCAFVSPVDGRVDEVSTVDRWDPAVDDGATRGGLSVSVVGADGVRYYGSHLRSIARGIAPGRRVRAGAKLGEIGTTGSARGTDPHLHFGISWPTGPGQWQIRRGAVYPWPYLDSWRRGGNRSPVAKVARARAAA